MLRPTFFGLILLTRSLAAQEVSVPTSPASSLAPVVESSSSSRATTEKVADRDPWAIQFDGLANFTPQKLRRALWSDQPFRASCYDSQSDEQFRSVLKDRLLAGLTACGFPEATVDVGRKDDTSEYVVTIKEGPEYEWGDLRFEAPPGTDLHYFTTTLDRLNNVVFAAFSKDHLSGWRRSGRAGINEQAKASVRTLLEAIAKKDGRHDFRFSVRFETQSENHRVHPVVMIENPGFHALIGDIQIRGLHANSSDEVCQYLKLAPGQRYDGALRDRITDELLNSGRFITAESSTDVPFADDHPVTLFIQVREYDLNPRLSQQTDQSEQAVIKLAQWINNWSKPEDQIELKLRLDVDALRKASEEGKPAPTTPVSESATTFGGFDPFVFLGLSGSGTTETRLICAPQQGSLLEHRVVDNDGRILSDTSVILQPGKSMFVEWDRKQKWSHQGTLPGASICVAIQGIPDETKKERFHVALGFATTSGTSVPLSPTVQINATALLDWVMSRGEFRSFREENGIASLRGDHVELTMDSASGRLLSCKAFDFGVTVEITCRDQLIEHSVSEIYGKSQTFADLYREGHTLSSLAQFIAPRVQASFEPSDSKIPELVDRVLNNAESLDGLEEKLDAAFTGGNFAIPPDPTAKTITAEIPWMLQWLDSSGPGGSTLDRLMALAVENDGAHSHIVQEFVLELAQNEQHGPLDCWLAAALFPNVSGQAASIGLTRLDASQFLHDLEPFLDEKWFGGEIALTAIGAVQRMSDDQVELLATAVDEISTPKLPGTALSKPTWNIRPIIALIRNSGGTPRQTLDSLLTLAWEGGIRNYVGMELVKLAARTQNQQPFQNVSISIESNNDTAVPSSSTETTPVTIERPEFLLDLARPSPKHVLQEQLDKIKVE